MLIKRTESCLLVVDVQEKLTPHIHASEMLVNNIRWLIQVAQRLKVPYIFSEQYPKGLKPTLALLKDLANNAIFMEKTEFSCAANEKCLDQLLKLQRPQIIITGIEAHVCVLQTAIGLAERGFRIFVVADAISSRSIADAELAIARMRHHPNIHIVSREMVLFEWVHDSQIPEFKALSKDFLQS